MVDQARSLTLALYNFRVNYRFSQVNHLSLHMAYYQHWRQSLHLDMLQAEIDNDIARVTDFLEQKDRDNRERFQQTVTGLGFSVSLLIVPVEFLGLITSRLPRYSHPVIGGNAHGST